MRTLVWTLVCAWVFCGQIGLEFVDIVVHFLFFVADFGVDIGVDLW